MPQQRNLKKLAAAAPAAEAEPVTKAKAAAEAEPVMEPAAEAEPGVSGSLIAMVLAADETMRKDMIDELLQMLIARTQPDLAAKITSMLSGMDNPELLHLLKSPEALSAKIDETMQKNTIGESLYPLIAQKQPDLAAKMTGMFLQMNIPILQHLLESSDALDAKIDEALEVLKNWEAAKAKAKAEAAAEKAAAEADVGAFQRLVSKLEKAKTNAADFQRLVSKLDKTATAAEGDAAKAKVKKAKDDAAVAQHIVSELRKEVNAAKGNAAKGKAAAEAKTAAEVKPCVALAPPNVAVLVEVKPCVGSSPSPLTAAVLAAASEPMQKNMIGERLYPLIAQTQSDLAGKITGMLLEMDNSELLHLLQFPDNLGAKIDEALEVIKAHKTAVSGGSSISSISDHEGEDSDEGGEVEIFFCGEEVNRLRAAAQKAKNIENRKAKKAKAIAKKADAAAAAEAANAAAAAAEAEATALDLAAKARKARLEALQAAYDLANAKAEAAELEAKAAVAAAGN